MSKHTLKTNRTGRQLLIEGLHVGDNGFREFTFFFTEGGEPFFLPEGSIATLYATLPGGSVIYDVARIEDDSVIYELKGGTEEPSITSGAGKVDCEIRVTDTEGNVITSPMFSFIIESVIQDDEAIEAQNSYSALTKTLIDVQKAKEDWEKAISDTETGLASKIDRVDGKEGNVVVFGKNGAIADGKEKPAKIYIVPYDTSKQGEIAEIVAAIKADKGSYAVYMEDGSRRIPASVIVARSTTITATLHDVMSYRYNIEVSNAGAVTLSKEVLYIYDMDEVEHTDKSPTGAVMTWYVQTYVQEQLGVIENGSY